MQNGIYAKVEKPYGRDKVLAFSLKQARVGAECTSSDKSFQTVGASNANHCSLRMLKLDRLLKRELQ